MGYGFAAVWLMAAVSAPRSTAPAKFSLLQSQRWGERSSLGHTQTCSRRRSWRSEVCSLGEPACLLPAAAHLEDEEGAALTEQLKEPSAKLGVAGTPTHHASGSSPAGCQV